MKTRTEAFASLAAAVVGIQVGAAIVASRFVIDQTQPVSLAFLRYSIGTLCLLPFVFSRPLIAFKRRDLIPMALLGITQFGIVIALMNYALQVLPSARVALVFASLPLQTMLIAALLKQETLTLSKSIGVVFTLVGVGLALGEKAFANANQLWTRELLVLLSAFAAALCTVLYRPYLKRYPTLQVSSYGMIASVLFLALLATRENFFHSIPRFTLLGWLAVVFVGVSSGLGYYLWLWALKNTTPTRVTIFLALNPITATLLGVILINEQPSFWLLTGLVFVVLGLAIAHIKKFPYKKREEV